MVSADLVSDILVRLPVKPLLRFSGVSKLWRKIITDHSFNALYHSRSFKTHPEYLLQIHSKPPCMCLISRCNEFFVEQEVLQLPVSSLTHPNITIMGSCNGLLCLVASNDKDKSFSDEIYLLNPAIRRLKLLPPSPAQPDRRWDLPPNSVWDPIPHHIGIGFNSLTADYKVVKIADIITTSPEYGWFTGAQIYSLRSNSWKTVTYFNSRIHICGFSSRASINGAFYWVAKKESKHHNLSPTSNKDLFILSFDFDEGTFKEIRLPESLYNERNFLLPLVFCMGEFKGKLYLMLKRYFSVEIWLMMEDSSWVKTTWPTSSYSTPLGLGMNKEIILSKQLWKQLWNMNDILVENLIVHNIDTGKVVVVHGTRETSNIFLYAPSLVLLGDESQSFEKALSSKHFLLGHHQMVKLAIRQKERATE